MKQTSSLTRRLTDAQVAHADVRRQGAAMTNTLYTLYTEDIGDVAAIVARYFEGATLYSAIGLWQGTRELAMVVEILTDDSAETLQRIVNLAGDIKVINHQTSVIVTWQGLTRLDV